MIIEECKTYYRGFRHCNFIILAFGFCEYEQPEATLRCIRLLNEWIIADKKLVVSVFSNFMITIFTLRSNKCKMLNHNEVCRVLLLLQVEFLCRNAFLVHLGKSGRQN